MPSGSSPLTRGKSGSLCPPRSRKGLIPAHAGKISWSLARTSAGRAHPRSRGENPSSIQQRLLHCGSSPLTRGKFVTPGSIARNPGLIPAHAGKMARWRSPRLRWRAHPRPRGENRVYKRSAPTGPGSSPLTRGKYFLTCAFIAQIGQILESRELCASSESYSLRNVYATAAPQDQVRSIGLAPLSSRGAS